jgi:hypothetical protein
LTVAPDDNGVTMRPITGPEELGLFNTIPYVLNDDLAEGRRRPEWMWVALRGDRLLARLAWWCRFAGDPSMVLDVLDLDDDAPAPSRVDVGERLLRTAIATALPDRLAAGRRRGRVRRPSPQRLQPDHRLPRRAAPAPIWATSRWPPPSRGPAFTISSARSTWSGADPAGTHRRGTPHVDKVAS